MAKRKYTNLGETPKAYRCTKCKWEGLHGDKKKISRDGWITDVCPKCNNEDFYGLLEKPKLC